MKNGVTLVEVLVSLLLIVITITFGFEAIVSALSTVNREEQLIKTVSLLNFVQSRLAEFRVGVELPNDVVEQINRAFHGNLEGVYPKVRNIQPVRMSVNVSGNIVTYRVVEVEIEKTKDQIERFTLIFGF